MVTLAILAAALYVAIFDPLTWAMVAAIFAFRVPSLWVAAFVGLSFGIVSSGIVLATADLSVNTAFLAIQTVAKILVATGAFGLKLLFRKKAAE